MALRDMIFRDMVQREAARRNASRVNRMTSRSLSAFMEAEIRTHRNLLAWQEAMKLVAAVYQITQGFPRNEWYGLAAQSRRSAISIPANIAEGAARNTTGEFVQFLGIATGSLSELETQMELSLMLKYLPENSDILRQVHRVGRLLTALRNALRNRDTAKRK